LRMRDDRRAIYVATGALLLAFVVTSGSILTYALISPEIEKEKDRNNLALVRNALRALDTNIRELLNWRPNATRIFTITIPKGTLTVDPVADQFVYVGDSRVSYDPGSTSSLEVAKDRKTVTITSNLPVDLVTKNTKIKAGSFVVKLSFEKESIFRVENWTLIKTGPIPGTVGTSSSHYYYSKMEESAYGTDINRDGDTADSWILYLSDPGEQYVFDTVAIHEADTTLIKVLKEGDSFELNGIPFMVYRVREKHVAFRYARIGMEVR